MPPLTQILGPLLVPPRGVKYEANLSREMEWLRELVALVPPVDGLQFNCHYRFTNWLPFCWAGYQQTTRYTYVFEDLHDLAAIYKGMSAKTRNIIRKSQKAGIVVEECEDIETFLPLLRLTFSRQGMEVPFAEELVRRIDATCAARDARKMFTARDREGRIHAILYHLYDNKCMYYLMQGSDPVRPLERGRRACAMACDPVRCRRDRGVRLRGVHARKHRARLSLVRGGSAALLHHLQAGSGHDVPGRSACPPATSFAEPAARPVARSWGRRRHA